MGKTILVTGASSGIGEAAALRLARAGHRVFAGVRKDEDGRRLAQAAAGIEPVILDVTDPATIAAARDRIAQDGGLDGLVNNAGIAVGGVIEFVPIEDLRRQLEVNVIGQVAVTQAFLDLVRARSGRIVNISSIGGRFANPSFGPYSASKFALEAISDSLRRELRTWGIHVAVIEPGSIATAIWDKGLSEAQARIDAMPARGQELYGELSKSYMKLGHEVAEKGIPADEVAERIEHALTASRPRTRYVVGREAKLQALFARLLPDRVLDTVVAAAVRRAG